MIKYSLLLYLLVLLAPSVWAQSTEGSDNARVIDNEFACRSDLILGSHLADAIQSGKAASGTDMSKDDFRQINAALEVLNNEENKHLSNAEKYSAVMELCASGRILNQRYEITDKE